MNRLFSILCIISLVLLYTSCRESVVDLESPIVELESFAIERRVRDYIQRARQGDVEAYKSLALCYRDGNGVEKSWLNMICMYSTYCQKTGGDIEDIIGLLDEGHTFRLLFEIMNSSPTNEDIEERLEQLKQLAPADAKAILAAKMVFSTEEDTAAMEIIREAEDEGSELAVVLQAIYYDEVQDKTGQEECLARIASEYPFFYLQLGESYIRKYDESKDFSYIQKAIECYYKADSYAMLIPKYANTLLKIYDYFGQKGMLEYNEQEVERLKILAKRTFKTE